MDKYTISIPIVETIILFISSLVVVIYIIQSSHGKNTNIPGPNGFTGKNGAYGILLPTLVFMIMSYYMSSKTQISSFELRILFGLLVMANVLYPLIISGIGITNDKTESEAYNMAYIILFIISCIITIITVFTIVTQGDENVYYVYSILMPISLTVMLFTTSILTAG